MSSKGQISVHRRIAEAISLKLRYDYLCFKGKMMNENYLIHTVGEMLIAFFGSQEYEVHTGFVHPVLSAPLHSRVGRKSEIDFVVTKRGGKDIEHAIELKWAGSSHCNFDNILWDLARLNFVKQHRPAATASLLIAGHTIQFERLFKTKYLKSGTQHPLAATILRRKNFSLTKNADHQIKINKLLSDWQKDYPNLAMPKSITTNLIDPRFSAQSGERFSSKIWTIS